MSKRYDIECREKDGILQWNDSGVLVACVEPRKEVTDQTNVLFRAKDDIKALSGIYLSSNTEQKDRYIRYFATIYPSTKLEIWKDMTLEKLQQIYENLEIWYDIGTAPSGKQTTRAAYKPFYRIPEGINLQQNVQHKTFPKNCWVEVYHAGNLNTDFYIPSQFFSGTYYYPSRGSGVFLRLGKSLIAPNKVSALKMLKVPNDVIFQYSGKSFKRWLTREAKYLKTQHPELPNEQILKLALDTQIEKMKNGKNYIRTGKEKKDMCLLFKIDEDHITIEQLNKCITSGKQNLINIENFAASMPSINYISLFDNSMLTLCNNGVNYIAIKLNIFLILCDNESWYNKKGYYSKTNHASNQTNNIIQINRNIIDFLIECFEKKNIKDETKINQLLDGIQLFTSDDVKKLSVQGFFNIVKEIMKRESNFCQDKYIWLRNILIDIYFSKLLQ